MCEVRRNLQAFCNLNEARTQDERRSFVNRDVSCYFQLRCRVQMATRVRAVDIVSATLAIGAAVAVAWPAPTQQVRHPRVRVFE